MTKPEDLVTIDDGVQGDDTMTDMYQLLRIDLVKKPPIKAQVLYSRIPKELVFSHKEKKRQNVGYISYSNPGDLFTLARHFFACGVALMLAKSMPFFGGGEVDVSFAVRDTLLKQIPEENGVIDLTKRYMKGLK